MHETVEAYSDSSAGGGWAQVVDVGGGTGFCTQGIVQHVRPENVTLIDQSPHQLAKARRKADLQGVAILEVSVSVSVSGAAGQGRQGGSTAAVHAFPALWSGVAVVGKH